MMLMIQSYIVATTVNNLKKADDREENNENEDQRTIGKLT